VADLIIRIGAKSDDLQNELEKIGKRTKNLEAQLGNIAKISGVAFAGLTATVGLAVNQFAQFDNQLRGVRTLLDDTSFGAKSVEQGFKEMRKGMLDVAAAFPVSIEGLNKALFDTVSAGVDAAEAIDVVAVSAKLATAGLTDVSVATDGLTSALNAYQISAEDADVVAAKFFTAQKAGKTTIEELSNGFGLVGSTAKATGVSIDELLGAVSAVTTAGVKTNAAYTGLKAALANISKPTAEAAQEAEKLGVNFDLNALQSQGLEGFLKKLTEAQGFTKESVVNLFGSVEAQNTIFALTGAQAGKFSDTVKALGDRQASVTTFTEAFNTQNASLSNSMTRLSNQVQVIAIEIGEQLAPAVVMAASALEEMLTFVSQHEIFAKAAAVILALGTVVAGATFAFSAGSLAVIKFAGIMVKMKAAAKVAMVALRGVSISVKGLIGATGIGLLIILVSDLVLNWKTRLAQAQAIFTAFTQNITKLGTGLGLLLVGVFSLNKNAIKAGLEAAKQAFVDGLQDFNDIRAEQTAVEEEQEAERNIAAQERADEEHEKKIEDRASKFEDILAQNEEFQAMTEAQQKVFLSKNESELEKQLLNEKTVAVKAADDRLKDQIKANNKFLLERQKFGTAVATISRAMQTAEVQGFNKGTSELAALSQSRNATLKKIGKAAAIAQIIIKTAQSAMNIYQGFSAIPFIGPVLGAAGAAAAIAFGAEQISKVTAAQQGGLITGGIPGVDSVPVLATPGELVVPQRNFEEVVGSVAEARSARTEPEEDIGTNEREPQAVMIGFDGEEASQVLTARQNEDRSLGISREGVT
jgi:TP901 family phage tail tape measure protein